MKTKKRNAYFGRYPSCDLCNNALRFILDGKPDVAFKEIAQAILKADGYFHDPKIIHENQSSITYSRTNIVNRSGPSSDPRGQRKISVSLV